MTLHKNVYFKKESLFVVNLLFLFFFLGGGVLKIRTICEKIYFTPFVDYIEQYKIVYARVC